METYSCTHSIDSCQLVEVRLSRTRRCKSGYILFYKTELISLVRLITASSWVVILPIIPVAIIYGCL